MTLLTLLTILALHSASHLLQTAPPPQSPAPAPSAPGETVTTTPVIVPQRVAPADADDTGPRELLASIQAAQRSIKSLRAQIKYDRIFGIAGDRQVRVGEFAYRDDRPQASRKSAVRFTTRLVGSRLIEEPQTFVFDGQWLTEVNHAAKQVIKRRVAADTQQADPMSIDGPLPIPIDQDPARVLERYLATLHDPLDGLEANDPTEDDAYRTFVANTRQLRLILRPEFHRETDIRDVRLWYRDQGPGVAPLPRLIRVENQAEDITYIQIINIQENAAVADELLRVADPPADWKVDIRDL